MTVKFVKFISCSECAKKLNELDKTKRDFLKERAMLVRCQTCEKVKLQKKGKDGKGLG